MATREQQQQYQQRPPYPQQPAVSSSATSSAFQSTSSLASLASINTMSQSSQLSIPSSSAPMPSPSAQQPANYFGSLSHPSHMQQQRMSSQQQASHVGQRHAGGAPETAPFLQDFNLIAEAAKRAQIACLSRDLGDCGL